MARTDEGKVKEEIKKILKSYDAYYFMPVQMGYGSTGAPDFLVCANGHFFGIEAKATEKEQPTGLQKKNMNEIRDAGGWAVVIHAGNLGALERMMKEFYDKDV